MTRLNQLNCTVQFVLKKENSDLAANLCIVTKIIPRIKAVQIVTTIQRRTKFLVLSSWCLNIANLKSVEYCEQQAP